MQHRVRAVAILQQGLRSNVITLAQCNNYNEVGSHLSVRPRYLIWMMAKIIVADVNLRARA